jgi:hypothetical protein
LVRKGFQVAGVDDVGADLIAAGRGQRYAVSVKTRLFRPGSRESRVTVIEAHHLRKLEVFAQRFTMIPLLAQVVCLADDAAIHLFVLRARELAEVLPAVKNGFSIRFGAQHLAALSQHTRVDYSCWREELGAGSWFGEAEAAGSTFNQSMPLAAPAVLGFTQFDITPGRPGG